MNGYSGRRQPDVAAQMFCNAAVKGDSQVNNFSIFSYLCITLYHCIVVKV